MVWMSKWLRWLLFPVLLLLSLVYYVCFLIKKWVDSMTQVKYDSVKTVCVGNYILGGSGKTVVVKKLAEEVKLKKKVVIVGLYSRIEIWDEKIWEDYKKQSEKNSQDIAERLADLGI